MTGRKTVNMSLRAIAISGILATGLFAASLSVEAQGPKKIPRVGYLSDRSLTLENELLPAFLAGLRELGYTEGKNIVIERRILPGGRRDELRELAAELIRLKVDVIVTSRGGLVTVARKLTTTTPIVFTVSSNPVAAGHVESLARPGGNVTGLSDFHGELLGKRLAYLKDVVPSGTRFAFLYADNTESGSRQLEELEAAASRLGLVLLPVGIKGPEDFSDAFARTKEGSPGGLVVHGNRLLSNNRRKIFDFTLKSRLPAIYTREAWVSAGGLMSYGANFPDIWRRVATYVDKILKGAKPAFLPVEQPAKFDLVINLETARQLDIEIPSSVLYRADKVIR